MQAAIGNIEQRVKNYWTFRAKDFAAVRKNELQDSISGKWAEEFEKYLPGGRMLDILDVGTGSGYFSAILSKMGHRLTGIDVTPAMLEEAKLLSRENGVNPDFFVMDAQQLGFFDNTFDAVVTRNLTWTLPEPRKAYAEWCRVLKPGGVMINFDANYGENVRNRNQSRSYVKIDSPYGHIGITEEMERENAAITLTMGISSCSRPEWDMEVLKNCGYRECGFDRSAGERILGKRDLEDAPIFLVWAVK